MEIIKQFELLSEDEKFNVTENYNIAEII